MLGTGCAEDGALHLIVGLRLGIIMEAAIQLDEVLRLVATAHIKYDAVDDSSAKYDLAFSNK